MARANVWQIFFDLPFEPIAAKELDDHLCCRTNMDQSAAVVLLTLGCVISKIATPFIN